LDLDLLSFSTLFLSPELVFSAACLVCRARQAFSCRFAIGFEESYKLGCGSFVFSFSLCPLLSTSFLFFFLFFFGLRGLLCFLLLLRLEDLSASGNDVGKEAETEPVRRRG
jgi:hypothetical protein